MNLIDQRFAALKSRRATALIPYVTVGDPDLDTSVDIILELERAGADIVELGVPYSDPLADGPVIQRAAARALSRPLTIVDCIAAAGKARAAGCKLPFILFTYYNPVLQLGFDRLFELLIQNDISGLIIPDLPYEENEEIRVRGDRHGIHLIPLVAPTSERRVAAIAAQARGFVYCVSSLGVTGMRTDFAANVETFLATVRASTDLPIAVGFGISNAEQFRRFARICDGVVVGSAIVKRIEDALPLIKSHDPGERREGLLQIREFVASLKE
jgi:tryptophan synthase alpha chain